MPIDDKATYYDEGGIETYDILIAKLTPEQLIGYCLGAVIKYTTRLNYKHTSGERDAEKICSYAALLLEAIREREIKIANQNN